VSLTSGVIDNTKYNKVIKTKFKTNTVIRTTQEIEDLRAKNETKNKIVMQEQEEESKTQNNTWDNHSAQGSNTHKWNQENNSNEWEYKNENLTPWDPINGFTLDWAFEITINVDEVPEETKYLLFANNWNFKLFFGNWTIWKKWEICFQKWWIAVDTNGCKSVNDKEIKISRDSDWNILLYWKSTWKTVSWDIEEFKVWVLPIWMWILRFTNTIEKITIK